MAVVDQHSGATAPRGGESLSPTPDRTGDGRTRPRRSRLRTTLRVGSLTLAVLVVVGVTAVAIDFLHFVQTVATAERPQDSKADAIVVLTGGADRIPGGLDLLREGRAERMLISGVGRRVTENALIARAPDVAGFADCCIDLGREAADTIGNAAEARKWAEERGFHSLFVVTSTYHIPRTLAEFGAALPGRQLIPYPVPDPGIHLDHWYDRPKTVRVLVREYFKYLMVRLRLGAERIGLVSTANASPHLAPAAPHPS